MLVLLLLGIAIVTTSVGIFLGIRLLLGPTWLNRLGGGILQFQGFRPKWEWDHLDELIRKKVGPESLVGRPGRAVSAFRPEAGTWAGRIWLEGTTSRAVASQPVAEGGSVVVKSVRGLTLAVDPCDSD